VSPRDALARLAERSGAAGTALLVVDMQNDFCHADGALAKRGAELGPTQAMLPQLLRLVEAARAAGLAVIYTANAHDDWTNSAAWRERQGGEGLALCRTGSWGAKFYGVRPAPTERVLVKHRYNAFVGTDLDLILRSRRIETLIFSGVATNVCVESTARDAFARNYAVVMARDCLAGSSLEEHEWALRSLERYFGAIVAEADAIAAAWEHGRTRAAR
jgi:ureidoacrylate peracid hydrolase